MTADEQRPPLNSSDPAEIEQRSGDVMRVTIHRGIDARCLDCGKRYGSTSTAASHSRSARHRVAVDYSTTFTYAPAELLDGAAR